MMSGGFSDDSGEIVAIDEHSALCLAAREAGSPLWQVLVDGTTYEKLVTVLAEQYATAPDQLEPDIDELFAVFEERGLLNW